MRFAITARGTFMKPGDRLAVIDVAAVAPQVHDAQIEHRARESLPGGRFEILSSLVEIDLDATPFQIHDAQIVLRYPVAALGLCREVPVGGAKIAAAEGIDARVCALSKRGQAQ